VTSDFTIVDRGEVILSAQDGNLLPYVPKQTLTAGFGYTRPMAGGVTLNSTASGYQQLGGFTTTDASATFLFASRWRVRLYGNNLTNQQGVSAAGPVLKNANLFPDYRVEYLMRPRTFGLSLAYTFE
jgi:outer membrane receptor protein involved in Fe transport